DDPPYNGDMVNAPAWRDDFVADWRDPARSAGVLSFVGHGNTFAWSEKTILTNNSAGCRNDVENPADDDVTGPGIPEPFVLNAGCITAGFMSPIGPALL